MAISLKVKSNYGGNLVSQKYQPVETPTLEVADKDDCLALANERINVLSEFCKLPRVLDFFTGGTAAAILNAEDNATSLPPLVVISSNRSSWIASGFARGADRLIELGLTDFTDVTDLRALDARPGPDARPIPAWYYPPRVNSTDRRIYVMVHVLEYKKYRKALGAVPNLHVIGWSFHADGSDWWLSGDYPYVGFGASRYAAIEFCKWLRRNSNQRWNYAWLVDDNVYYLNSFRGLAQAEAAMLARGYVGLGFGSETATDTTDAILDDRKAKRRFVSNPGGTYAGSTFRKDRVLQQAVLWNIDWLDQHNLNFSPYFIASAEDTSITNYLDTHGHAFGITTESTILKQTNSYFDDDKLGKTLNSIRYNYERWYAITEGARGVINKEGAATPVPLKDLIVNSVFPVSQIKDQATKNEARNRAICQATESILAVGVKHDGFTPDQLFQPNGNQQQVTSIT